MGIIGVSFHLTQDVVTVSPQPRLDSRKTFLNRVQIRRIGREINKTHFAIKEYGLSDRTSLNDDLRPFDHFTYTGDCMNSRIVHNEDRIRKRPWIHLIQETMNEILEFFSGECMIDHLQM
jgi:hypothetical protein